MIENKINKYKYIFLLVAILMPIFFVKALDSTSINFKVTDSSFKSMNEMSSTNFSLFGILSQFSIGSSTANTFKLNSGFLYFPKVTSPILISSAGNSQVNLSWTASEGFLGTNIGGYLIGQSEVSGGPYIFTSVGNVTNALRESLVNGRTYYFIVEAQDSFGEVVAMSSEVSVLPIAPVIPPSGGGGGGGGGGGVGGGLGNNNSITSSTTKITIKGLAYPLAKIVILKDASVGAEVTADADGNFQATFPVATGVYSFGIYALDKDGFKSPTFGFTVNSMSGQTVTTSDVIVAPTIGADKTMVKVGNIIKFFGYSYPISSVNIMINSENEILDQTKADKYGRWIYSLKTDVLEVGDHTSRSQTVANKNIASVYSQPLSFKVGDKDILSDNKGPLCSTRGDINNDSKINITDFSILMYFWNKTNPSNSCADINLDGKVDLRDFSIMLYWWTGK